MTKSNPKHTGTSRSGDLVERLRERTCVVFNSPGVHPDTECLEAADRIEALEAENERLREALELCLGELYAPEEACSCHISPPCGDCVEYSSIRNAITIARAALKEIDHGDR